MKGNRQGFLEVNWPKTKRSRPGPFTYSQSAFHSEEENAVQKNVMSLVS